MTSNHYAFTDVYRKTNYGEIVCTTRVWAEKYKKEDESFVYLANLIL